MPRRAKPAGGQYPNRSDLQAQPPRAPTNMAYGEHKAMIEAQQAMPMPQAPPPPTPQPGAPQGGVPFDQLFAQAMQEAEAMEPMQVGMNAPTSRPNEPITAGLSSGPGPGPEVLSMRPMTPLTQSLRTMAEVTGDPAIFELLDIAEARGQ